MNTYTSDLHSSIALEVNQKNRVGYLPRRAELNIFNSAVVSMEDASRINLRTILFIHSFTRQLAGRCSRGRIDFWGIAKGRYVVLNAPEDNRLVLSYLKMCIRTKPMLPQSQHTVLFNTNFQKCTIIWQKLYISATYVKVVVVLKMLYT
jgi:hypothetical protein